MGVAEQQVYEKIYEAGFPPMYGHGNHWAEAAARIAKMGILKLADIGTGQGDFPTWAFCNIRPAVQLAIGVDFAGVKPCEYGDVNRRLVFLKAPATELPIADKSVEYATSFDLLEHLPEPEVETALLEMRRIATVGMIHSVSSETDQNGLHPTVKSQGWWIGRIRAITGATVERDGRYLFCNFVAG